MRWQELTDALVQWWDASVASLAVDMEKLHAVAHYDPSAPLLFNTGLFLLLFVAFMLAYTMLSRWRVPKMLLVIAFSLYFYYKSSYTGCFILLGVCVSDYLLGLLMGRCHKWWQRRAVVALNVVMNVGMLVYFKYLSLIVETVTSMASLNFDVLDIVLPAGISFFTFRSISYIVDLYRGEMEPCRNFLNYTFYLTFFPPLLAGPVVRAKDMLPQVENSPAATRAMVSEGLLLIMAGLVKKVIVADYISGNFVDRVFDNPSLYSGLENLLAVYGFSIQLYCDFSGYSDMAIGLALLMGYRFKDNFAAPFKAQSPGEFWHRWHISLSTWLRDYIYIPLGGNRKGAFRTYLNNFLTMVIGGLWHGASWMYVIWGALHGVWLVLNKWLKRLFPVFDRRGKPRQWWRVAVNIIVTFNLMAFTFVFFRARSLEAVGDMATQIATNFHADVAMQLVDSYLGILLAMALGYTLHFMPARWTLHSRRLFGAAPALVRALVLAIVILLVIQVRSSEIVPFIYLQY